MIKPHEFTWQERGKIDHLIGTFFADCPASDLFDRQEWEKGWLSSAARKQTAGMHFGRPGQGRLSPRMPETA